MLKKRIDTVNIFSRLLLDCIWINVVKTIINHPPVITILMGGINHQKHGVVYDIVLPTLTHLPIRSSSRLASSLFDVFFRAGLCSLLPGWPTRGFRWHQSRGTNLEHWSSCLDLLWYSYDFLCMRNQFAMEHIGN
jgi:hypothetical protein